MSCSVLCLVIGCVICTILLRYCTDGVQRLMQYKLYTRLDFKYPAFYVKEENLYNESPDSIFHAFTNNFYHLKETLALLEN